MSVRVYRFLGTFIGLTSSLSIGATRSWIIAAWSDTRWAYLSVMVRLESPRLRHRCRRAGVGVGVASALGHRPATLAAILIRRSL
jgi:hypothetical protein